MIEEEKESIIPEGYNQLAQSLLPGTGGVMATAYHKTIEGEKWIFIKIDDPVAEDNEVKEYGLGPMPIRLITTINHVIGDVMSLNRIHS